MTATIVSYSAEKYTEHPNLQLKDALKIKDSVIWVDVENPVEAEIKELRESYGFHHLALEDCMHDVQRPKIEFFDNYLFVVLRHVKYEKRISTKQLSVFVSDKLVVTIHKEPINLVKGLRDFIKEGGHRVNKRGTDYFLYKIIDGIVDNYFTVLDIIEDEIEIIEDEVMSKPTKAVLKNAFKTKKDLLLLRKPIWPLREVLHAIQSGAFECISDETLPYFRDTYDHIINIIDLIETYRELVTTALETYLSSISNSLNEVIKVLTVVSAILMVPTLIASIYGMNFKFMPELSWTFGYPLVLLTMLGMMLLLYAYFRKKRWV
jgi:magnesium transporter